MYCMQDSQHWRPTDFNRSWESRRTLATMRKAVTLQPYSHQPTLFLLLQAPEQLNWAAYKDKVDPELLSSFQKAFQCGCSVFAGLPSAQQVLCLVVPSHTIHGMLACFWLCGESFGAL